MEVPSRAWGMISSEQMIRFAYITKDMLPFPPKQRTAK